MSDHDAKADESEEARELRAILCDGCYRSLLAWVTGRSLVPYVPCDPCAPKSLAWLEARWNARRPSGRDPNRECIECAGRSFRIRSDGPYKAWLQCSACGKRQP